jgi:DNA-binding Lrp family transcriptional regulator
MTRALVFVNCDYRSLSTTINALRKVKGVIETSATSGVYDAILKVNASSETELARIIKRVATVSGVLGIVTSIIMAVK